MAPESPLRILQSITSSVPHNEALGLRFVSWVEGRVTLALPYDEKLVGNPLTGVLHGGAITAVLDAACGMTVLARVAEPIPVATLDLRIDYLRPATPRKDVYARAECFRVTQRIAFVRCEAFHEGGESEVVAVANGTFMLLRERGRAGSDAP